MNRLHAPGHRPTSAVLRRGSLAAAAALLVACASRHAAAPQTAPAGSGLRLPAEEAACDRGDAEACARAADPLTNKVAATADERKLGFKLYERSCSLHSETGCLGLSLAYGGGRGVAEDKAKALELLRASCNRGHPRGCTLLGDFLGVGVYGPRDEPAARAICMKGPAAARAEWCAALAGNIQAGDMWGTPALVLQYLERSCAAADAAGCVSLAIFRFRQGQRLDALDQADRLCAGGVKGGCTQAAGMRDLMAMEERDGGGPPGTPPAPLHLRVAEFGLSYDPPGEFWGTGVPTHPGGPASTMWRWHRDGLQIEVAVIQFPGTIGGPEQMRPEQLQEMARLGLAGMHEGNPIQSEASVLAGRPCGHAFADTGLAGRIDLYVIHSPSAAYSFMMIQPLAFAPALLEAAKRGLRIEN